MEKIQIIIFSFNRAMQLDALLRSIETYIDKNICSDVEIIYNISSAEFEIGYTELKKRYHFSFTKETNLSRQLYRFKDYLQPFNWKKLLRYPKVRKPKTDFRQRVLQILGDSSAEFTMFLTDDSIFIRKVELREEWLKQVAADPFHTQLSLRLGENYNVHPNDGITSGDLLSWNYSKNPRNTDWGYRFSVDAHIYQTKSLKKVLNTCVFTNPSYLEGFVQDYANVHGLWDVGLSLLSPCIVSYPLNMVQDVAHNESQNVSPQMMNDFFMKGYRIVYPIPSKISTFQQYPEYVEFIHPEQQIKERVALSAPTY